MHRVARLIAATAALTACTPDPVPESAIPADVVSLIDTAGDTSTGQWELAITAAEGSTRYIVTVEEGTALILTDAGENVTGISTRLDEATGDELCFAPNPGQDYAGGCFVVYRATTGGLLCRAEVPEGSPAVPCTIRPSVNLPGA